MWRLPAIPAWDSGGLVDLAKSLGAGDNRQSLPIGIARRYLEPYASQNLTGTATGTNIGDIDRRNYLEMLSIFQQLTPPVYLKASADDSWESSVAFHRELGRELDLSPWFNRPCLIVIGLLEDAPSPVPLRIDGETDIPVTNSMTVVRWVYPLPLNERLAFPEVFEPAAP
jgi:hypothetical protein